MSLALLYLLMVLSKIQIVMIGMGVIGGIVLMALAINAMDDASVLTGKAIKLASIYFFCSVLLMELLPSEDDIYKIAGGYIATNGNVDALPDSLVKAANAFLKRAVKE